MTEHRPTEPLRSEHRDLLPHLLALDTAANDAATWDRDTAVATLGDLVGFLRGHLVPELPGSVLDSLRPSTTARRSDGLRHVERALIPTAYVTAGKQELTLRVRERR